jgi:triosephosphate isomerase
MRKKIVAGNWKMNLNLTEGLQLVDDLLKNMPQLSEERQVVIAPPFIHIVPVAAKLKDTDNIYLAAQNCYSENAGAFTGEVAAPMLKSAGATFVILGHSERREYFNESDALLAKKTDTALAAGLQVIFCCGEPLSVRDAGTQNDYVESQIKAGLFHLSAEQLKDIVIAYEPIWAIGTGRTATSAQAQDMHAHIRSVISHKYGAQAAANMPILYGGSCKPSNAAELFACADVDGGLIGGASLKAEEFLAIVTEMVRA